MSKRKMYTRLVVVMAWVWSMAGACQSPSASSPFFSEITPIPISLPDSFPILGNVRGLKSLPDGYVLADWSSYRLYKFNRQFEQVWSIGREGKGPEEFIGKPIIYPHGRWLYALERNRLHRFDLATGNQVNFYTLPSDWPNAFFVDQIMVDQSAHLWYATNVVNGPGVPKLVKVAVAQPPSLIWEWGKRGEKPHLLNQGTGIHLLLPDSTFLWFPDHLGGIRRIKQDGSVVDTLPIQGSERYVSTREAVRQAHQKQYEGNWTHASWRIFNNPFVLGDYAIVGSLRDDLSAVTEGMRGRWVVLRWNPQLEYAGEWETDHAYGHQYLTFCLASDSLAILAYEQERGEFHRIPLPKELLELTEEEH